MSTLAAVAAVAAGGVAGLLNAVASLDEGRVAAGVRHSAPRQHAVSF